MFISTIQQSMYIGLVKVLTKNSLERGMKLHTDLPYIQIQYSLYKT